MPEDKTSFYDDVLKSNNDRMGFNAEKPASTSIAGCNEGKLRSYNASFKAKSGDNVSILVNLILIFQSVTHKYTIDKGLQKNVTSVNWADLFGSGFDYGFTFENEKIEESLEGEIYNEGGNKLDIDLTCSYDLKKNKFAGTFGQSFCTGVGQ